MIIAPEFLVGGIFTTLTNLALFIFIACTRRLRRSKHATVASSLVTGILFATIYIIPRFAFLYNNGIATFPRDFRCGILSRIGQSLFLSLNLHLLTHVLELYIQVVYPFRVQEWLQKKTITIILAVIWSITLLIPIILQMYFEIKAVSDDGFDAVECAKVSVFLLTVISIVLATLSIIILTVSSVAYGHVLKITNDAIKQTQKVLNHLSCNFNQDTKQASREKKKMNKLKLRIKSTIQALIFYLFYLLSLLPFLIMVIYTQFAIVLPNKIFPPVLSTVFRYLQYIAFFFPAVQPILFLFFTAEFRNQLRRHRKSMTSTSSFSLKKQSTTMAPSG